MRRALADVGGIEDDEVPASAKARIALECTVDIRRTELDPGGLHCKSLMKRLERPTCVVPSLAS